MHAEQHEGHHRADHQRDQRAELHMFFASQVALRCVAHRRSFVGKRWGIIPFCGALQRLLARSELSHWPVRVDRAGRACVQYGKCAVGKGR